MAARTPKAKLRAAARARYEEGLAWHVCAEEADIPERTLRRLRAKRDPKWLEAVAEVAEQIEDEGLPAALGCLVRMATENDVSAARTLLERYRAAKFAVVAAPRSGDLKELSNEDLDAQIERLEKGIAQRQKALGGEQEED